MDAYLTTYKKDYKWPVVPPKSFKSINESVTLENKLDACCREVVTPKFTKPEVHEIQICSMPSAANTDNQPDGFLGQLYDANPYLYKIEKQSIDDAKLNVIRQRFISTYQRDFCAKKDIVQREEIAQEKRNMCSKIEDQLEDEDVPRSKLRKPAAKSILDTPKKKSNKNEEGFDDSKKLWKPQISEYMDKISNTGAMIMEQKLLKRKPR